MTAISVGLTPVTFHQTSIRASPYESNNSLAVIAVVDRDERDPRLGQPIRDTDAASQPRWLRGPHPAPVVSARRRETLRVPRGRRPAPTARHGCTYRA